MLKDFGLNWVILGHSERRHVFGETDQQVGLKVKNALDNDLSVMACIGEKIEERNAGKMMEVNARQLAAIREHVEDWSKVVVAYEPVWAIGTGVTASPQQAQDAHAEVREWLAANVSAQAAKEIRILYGGSVTDKNANELISGADIDGFLVGGAALKPDFLTIIDEANKYPNAQA